MKNTLLRDPHVPRHKLQGLARRLPNPSCEHALRRSHQRMTQTWRPHQTLNSCSPTQRSTGRHQQARVRWFSTKARPSASVASTAAPHACASRATNPNVSDDDGEPQCRRHGKYQPACDAGNRLQCTRSATLQLSCTLQQAALITESERPIISTSTCRSEGAARALTSRCGPFNG